MPTWRVMALATVCVLAVVRPAWAGPPSEQLRTHIDRVLKVLGDPELRKNDKVPERRAAIRKIANDIFDFREITMRSLGRHWQPRSASERDEIVELFANLLEQAYISRIEGYTGEKIVFLGESIDGDQATVRSKIVTNQGTEIPIDYRLLPRGDRWVVYDVAIEGVSIVANYRTQFNAIIQRSSYAELVKRLKAKRDERADARPATGRPERDAPVSPGLPRPVPPPRQAP
jgi:phospholipid transport system substrate-binding protein